jgi:hypothetical protein
MKCLVIVLILVLAASAASGAKPRCAAYRLMDPDFGIPAGYDGALQYYYYIPAPTYSWFWAFSGWEPGDIIGTGFDIGDAGTGGYAPVDPLNCHTIGEFRILDFAGYGTTYPGSFTVEFDMWCALGGPSVNLWNSGPWETGFGWNYIPVDPPVCVTGCMGSCCGGDPAPIVLVTATHTGTEGTYPAWGFDNVSMPIAMGAPMHDYGCLPATYPRGPVTPGVCHGNVHGGYFGNYQWEYLPPLSLCDCHDTTEDCSQYGYLELAWRIYIICQGPSSSEPSSWSSIKSMYR